jgi:NAD(P)-dependent dehydrogenase (short-subunit alcohol dehydrogenase family)
MPSRRIVVVGATGTIGKAIVAALGSRFEVIPVSHRQGAYRVDLADAESIRRTLTSIGKIDAIISAAGVASFAPFATLTDDDFWLGIRNKLMGQVNVARIGAEHLNDGGSITLTSGILSRRPMPGGAAISLVNAALEGFVRGAAIELPRGIRINVVAPPWVTETLIALKMDPGQGKPAAEVARAYLQCVDGNVTGQVVDA